jgi:hypothetical protein
VAKEEEEEDEGEEEGEETGLPGQEEEPQWPKESLGFMRRALGS